jgi:hypothetical protein
MDVSMKLYQELSLLIQHLTLTGFNPLHAVQHARLEDVTRRLLCPIENDVQITFLLDKCSRNYLVLQMKYNHHGDDYSEKPEDGLISEDLWTTHKVTIEPSFVSILDITVKGPKIHKAHWKVEQYLKKQLMVESILSEKQFDEIFGAN